jgi:S1-C subfamily serine protease
MSRCFFSPRNRFLLKAPVFIDTHPSKNTLSPSGFFRFRQPAVLCSVTIGLMLGNRVTAQPASPAAPNRAPTVVALENALTSAIARAEKSVVAITRTPPNQPFAMLEPPAGDAPLRHLERLSEPSNRLPLPNGLGVVVDRTGLILTLSLLVTETDQHTVTTTTGKRFTATVKASDPRSGLAILEVNPTDLPPIQFGNADDLRKGELVIAIGNPHTIVRDGQPSASWGIISNLAQRIGSEINLGTPDNPTRTNQSLHQLGTLIQTDAKLAFSTGGGALVNLRGELIGLTTSAATIAGHERPAGYAIPMNTTFRRVIDTLKEGREVEYGLIGVGLGSSTGTTIIPLDPKLHATDEATFAPTGVPIQNVMPGSPAALAGLRTGDRITHINDHPVENAQQLQLLVGTLRPATITQVRYRRGETPRRVSIELAKYPLESRAIVTEHSPAWRGIRVDYSTTAELARNAPGAIASTPDPAGCVVIREVLPDSPSWKAGIRPGMYISHVADQRVTSPKAFRNAVDAAEGTVSIHLTQPIPGKPEPKRKPQTDPLLPGSRVEL